MAELGWAEGKNFVFDCVSIIGRLDQLQALARELVSRRPDVVCAGPSNLVRALSQETTTIPIVMIASGSPVESGLVTNLARPEGNVTGVAWSNFIWKQIEFMKEIIPHLSRYALVTSAHLDTRTARVVDENVTMAANRLGFTWQRFRAVDANDFDDNFMRIASEHFDAASIIPDPLIAQNAMSLIELAQRHRIPTSAAPDWARGGLLLGYGQNPVWSATRAAEYIDKILRGAKPNDLPVEEASKLELVINLKTAKTLGLTVPSSLIARADELIE